MQLSNFDFKMLQSSCNNYFKIITNISGNDILLLLDNVRLCLSNAWNNTKNAVDFRPFGRIFRCKDVPLKRNYHKPYSKIGPVALAI